MLLEKRYGRTTLIVDDLENIPSYEIAGLEVGDCVVLKNDGGGDNDGYVVVYKDNAQIDFVQSFGKYVYQYTYLFNDETKEWEFDGFEECEIKYGLEFIEWDGERNFTEEEVAKLLTGKVGVKKIARNFFDVYLPAEIYEDDTIYLTSVRLNDDDNDSGLFSLAVANDGTFETFGTLINDLKGTKLYKHTLNLSNIQGFNYFVSHFGNDLIIINNRSEPFSFSQALSLTQLFNILKENALLITVQGVTNRNIPSNITLALADDLTEIDAYGDENKVTLIVNTDIQDIINITDTVEKL